MTSEERKTIHMMYIGTHVINLQDSMSVIFEVAKRLGITVYWAADFSRYKGNKEEIPCTILQTDFVRHPLLSHDNFKAIGQLRKYIRDNNINFIHCNTPIGSFCGRIAGKLEKVPVVIYTAHGLPFFKGAPRWRFIFKRLEYALAHFTDYAVAMNEEDYLALSKMPLRKNTVFKIDGVGIPLKELNNEIRIKKRKELNISEDRPLVICVGRLEKVKGLDISIEAFAKTERKDSILLICGEGPERERLQKKIQALGIDERVYFLGFRKDVFDLMQASDIYLLTSYYEGLPRSLMEAMHAGLSCVVSDARGNIDLIRNEENGLVVARNDVDGTSAALDRLYNSEELRSAYGNTAKQDVAKCGMDNIIVEYTNIYRTVLGVNEK